METNPVTCNFFEDALCQLWSPTSLGFANARSTLALVLYEMRCVKVWLGELGVMARQHKQFLACKSSAHAYKITPKTSYVVMAIVFSRSV